MLLRKEDLINEYEFVHPVPLIWVSGIWIFGYIVNDFWTRMSLDTLKYFRNIKHLGYMAKFWRTKP